MKQKLTILVISIVLVMVVAASTAFAVYKPGFVYRVYVDGIDIGTVSDLDEYAEILGYLLDEAENETDLSLDFAQEVSAQREFQWGPETDADQVQTSLETVVSFITVGWAIAVEGETLLWLAEQEQAEEVLEMVGKHYSSESSTRKLVSAEILDDVEIRSEEVLPEDIVDVETATAIITQGREKIETYVVSRGDSLWSIARSANMSENQLRDANPNLKSNVLSVGQTLNLVMAEPQINVRTVETVLTYESIPFTTSYRSSSSLWYYQSRTAQAGVPGRREVSYEVEFINGVEVSRKELGSRVESQPVTRIVEQGTARWPSQATGMFRWPLNSGRISDRFGSFQSWRNQRHQGVDIAVGTGTPIYAAAGGTVETSTYHNSYGNYVIIDHGNGYKTLYAHASSLAVRVGQRVSKGDLIARVGSTGFSTGPHLHFEVRRNGNPIDPIQFFRP